MSDWPTPVVLRDWYPGTSQKHKRCAACSNALHANSDSADGRYWLHRASKTRLCCECFEHLREDKPPPQPQRIVLAEGAIVRASPEASPLFALGDALFDSASSEMDARIAGLMGAPARLVIEVLPTKPCPNCKGRGTVPVGGSDD